jgi:hypothetical protein
MTATMTTPGSIPIEPDFEVEARRLLAEVARRDLDMRLIGGMGIRLLAGDRLHPAFDRTIQDLDFMVSKRHGREGGQLLTDMGYVGDEQFNALNGSRRLLYFDPIHGRQIDVFVETFEMCHALPLSDRIAVRPETLPAADLLMTKLQIVELNDKDRGDLYALLDTNDEAALELDWIAELTGNDWGLQRTFEINLGRLREGLAAQGLEPERAAAIDARIGAIEAAMTSAPKSRRWKLRDRVGERKRWYEEPEEVDR